MATVTITFTTSGSASTSVTATLQGVFAGGNPVPVPVAANTLVALLNVQPAGWAGVYTLSGPDAGSFVLNSAVTPAQLLVGPAGLTTAKVWSLVVSTAP